MDGYLRSLERRLDEAAGEGPAPRVEVMRSGGGTFDAALAAREPVHTLLSGPAAGAWGAAAVAREVGLPDAVAFDMGGTSSDVTLVRGGRPQVTTGGSIDGLPFAVSTTAIHTVGAGGGSIAWRDDGGALRVGPRSAGAEPGPACYGRGGTQPTVTDADLLLGRLDATTRLGGSLALDVEAARAAVATLADELGLSTGRTARGIAEVVEAEMARALRVVSVEQGHDPRDLALLAFGGAGGLHQAALAREVGFPRVVVPPSAGVLSALGLLAAPVTAEASRTVLVDLDDADLAMLEEAWDDLAAEARDSLDAQGVAAEHLWRTGDLRYRGQAFELAVPVAEVTRPALADGFHAAHRERYGYDQPDVPVEVVTLHVRAEGPTPEVPLPRWTGGGPADDAVVATRRLPVDGSGRGGGRTRAPGGRGAASRPGRRDRAGVDRVGGRVAGRARRRGRRPAPHGTGEVVTVDPITLEVVRNALVGVAEEAGAALRRTASSPNIKERMDCSTAVFDAEARMIAQAEHIPVHLGSMPASVHAAIEAFDDLGAADQVLLSDPFAGGTHLPDWTLVAPVDVDGGRVGYVATRAHHADVGGSAPGSMPADATEVFAEGLRIPPVRLVRDGAEDRDVLALLLANTRTPEERIGDLRAQAGANRLAARRMAELVARHGHDGLAEAMAATLDHAERTVRATLRDVPDGEATFTDWLDGDGIDAVDVPITARVRLSGERLDVDFDGTADQVAGNVNAPFAVTVSAVVYVLRAVFAPDVPANDGATRPLTVTAREGSIVRPLPPAACAAGNVETSQRIVDVVLGALAELVPDRVPAASQGTMNNTLAGGPDPRTGRRFSYYETLGGGAGAGPWGPGTSGVQVHMTNTRNTPVEAFEVAYPLRVVEYRLRDGSGGDGLHHGGDGIRRVLEVLGDQCTVSLVTERRVRGPWGLAGGGDGAPGRNLLVRDGEETELPAKVTLRLRRGDRLVVETPGGGGWGTP